MSTATAPATVDPAAGPTHRQVLTVLSGLLVGMFLAALDQTVVSTAMRTIADDLKGQTAQAWVTTSYLVASTVTTPLYGKLSDLYGRKPFYLFAIGIFVLGSVLCGTAGSVYELAGYRAIQGVGAGGLFSLAFTIIGDLVAPRERARYQAYFVSVFATSSVLGPLVGGGLAGQDQLLGLSGWRWIFFLNVPIGLAAFAVVVRVLHLPATERREARIDYVGAALLTSTVVPVLLLAEKGRDFGWGSALSLGLIALSVASLATFIPWERRMGEDAILPLRIFANAVFSRTSVVAVLVGIAMFGSLVMIPLYLQIVQGSSPTRAGLQTLPLMVGLLGASMTSGRVMSRTGRYKVFPVVGTATMFTGIVLFSTLGLDTPLWHAMVYMTVVGAGLGMSMQTLVLSVQNALPPRDMGVATSSVTFFRSVGGSFGAAISLAVLFGSVLGNIKERAIAAGAPQAVLDRFDDTSSLDDTTIIATLPDAVQRIVLQGFADSMSTAFLVVAVLLVPAFFLALTIRELPLRTQGGLAAAEEERARAEAAIV